MKHISAKAALCLFAISSSFTACSNDEGHNRTLDGVCLHVYYKIWEYFVPDTIIMNVRWDNAVLFSFSGKESYKYTDDTECFRKIAAEHGETGDSLMAYIPHGTEILTLGLHQMKVISMDDNAYPTDVSSEYSVRFTSVELSREGYVPEIEKSLCELTANDLKWISPYKIYLYRTDGTIFPDGALEKLVVTLAGEDSRALESVICNNLNK